MHPMDIITLLYKRDSNLKKVAQATGVTPSIVSRVVHGKTVSRNVATYISGFVQVPLEELWPGVYNKSYKHNMRAA